MPISFYPLIDASANDTGQGSIEIVGFGVSTPSAVPDAGQSYGAGLIEITLLAIDEAGGDAPPIVPDEVVCFIELELFMEDAAYTTDIGSGDVSITAHGFSLLPNEDVGEGYIEISLNAGSPTPFEDSIFHIEQLPVMGGAIGIFVEEVTDDLLMGMTESSLPVSVIRDWVGAGDSTASRSDATRQLHASMGFTDTMFAIERMLVEEGIALGGAVDDRGIGLLSIMEQLLLDGTATSAAEAVTLVTEAIALHDLMGYVNRERVTDVVELGGAVAESFTAAESLVDTLLLSALPVGQGRAVMAVVDDFAFGAEPVSLATAVSQMREAVGFAMTLSLDDGIYMATVVNTSTKGTSEYRNYPFNSFALLGDRYFGMSPDGIRLLEGEDDDGDPILWRARLARTNLGTLNLKRMRPAYLGYSGTGELYLKVIVQNDTTNQLEAHAYRLHSQPAGAAREARVSIGQGLLSAYWGFELESIDGGKFDFDKLSLDPILIGKIMKGEGGGQR